ncbi:MAG TPA: hypothetical protein VGF70_02460 [Solirubrobacteraceae bacterium]|jgi:hypothetical protein
MIRWFLSAALLAAAVVVGLAGCGSAASRCEAGCAGPKSASRTAPAVPRAHPQAIQPTAGVQAPSLGPQDPVGNPHAHAPPISEVRAELKQFYVAVKKSNATYIDPLVYVNHWERTDQGVDATMPVGAPILAPGPIKVLAIIPDWYAGQPLVYWELLTGQYAGHIQYVAEEITDIARPGSFVRKGGVIARYAPSGTAIEFGWSTPNGVTLARATTGYEEGQVTPAGVFIRDWLNSLGANAGPS